MSRKTHPLRLPTFDHYFPQSHYINFIPFSFFCQPLYICLAVLVRPSCCFTQIRVSTKPSASLLPSSQSSKHNCSTREQRDSVHHPIAVGTYGATAHHPYYFSALPRLSVIHPISKSLVSYQCRARQRAPFKPLLEIGGGGGGASMSDYCVMLGPMVPSPWIRSTIWQLKICISKCSFPHQVVSSLVHWFHTLGWSSEL